MRNSYASFVPYSEKSVNQDSGYGPASIKSVPEHLLEAARQRREQYEQALATSKTVEPLTA